MQEFSYLTAFSVGLMGGVHCIGMCGGIVGALTMGSNSHRQGQGYAFILLLAYNLARITSYTIAGVFMGGVGWFAAHWLDIHAVQTGLQLFAALFLLLLGLYITGWWPILIRVENMGRFVWRFIEPVARRLLPVRTTGQAALLGLLWGWLPCGLVYSVLVWSVSTGDALEGGLLMLSFGLGTLPNLLAMGVFAQRMNQVLRKHAVRTAAGVMILLFGAWQLLLVVNQGT